MRLIDREEADLVNIDAEDLYLGGRIYNLEPLVIEEYGGSEFEMKSYTTEVLYNGLDL